MGYPEAKVVLKDFLAYPYSWKHLQHCIKYVYKYLVANCGCYELVFYHMLVIVPEEHKDVY